MYRPLSCGPPLGDPSRVQRIATGGAMRMPTGKDRRDRQTSEMVRERPHRHRTSTEDASRPASLARLDLVGLVPAETRRDLSATGTEAAMPLHLTASRVEKVPPW